MQLFLLSGVDSSVRFIITLMNVSVSHFLSFVEKNKVLPYFCYEIHSTNIKQFISQKYSRRVMATYVCGF